MKLTLLGTGTMVPSLQRHSSALLIQEGGAHSLVDFGYGALHQLLRLKLTYHDIDRIYFTHIHPDHMYDLVPFLFACRYPEDPRRKNLQIVAGPGFKTYFDGLRQAYQGWLDSEHFAVEIIEQDETTNDYGGLQVAARKVKHLPISRGFRFTDSRGKSITISGDSDYCESLIELGRDADLLVLNCAMPDEKKIRRAFVSHPGRSNRQCRRLQKTLPHAFLSSLRPGSIPRSGAAGIFRGTSSSPRT